MRKRAAKMPAPPLEDVHLKKAVAIVSHFWPSRHRQPSCYFTRTSLEDCIAFALEALDNPK